MPESDVTTIIHNQASACSSLIETKDCHGVEENVEFLYTGVEKADFIHSDLSHSVGCNATSHDTPFLTIRLFTVHMHPPSTVSY